MTISVDQTGSNTGWVNDTTETISGFTVNNGTSDLFVGIAEVSSPGITSVVWDPAGVNEALSEVATAHYSGAQEYARLYRLRTPTPGSSKNIVVTWGGTNGRGSIGAMTILRGGSVMGTADLNDSGGSSSHDDTVNTGSGASGISFEVFMAGNGDGSYSLASGQTAVFNTSISSTRRTIFAYKLGAVTSLQLTWTNNTEWAHLGVALDGVTAGNRATIIMSKLLDWRTRHSLFVPPDLGRLWTLPKPQILTPATMEAN